MTAKENKKIADEALINKITAEIDKSAKDGALCYGYDKRFPKNVIYHFLTLGYCINITLFGPSTIFDWSGNKDGIYFRPNAFADYKNVDIEEVP